MINSVSSRLKRRRSRCRIKLRKVSDRFRLSVFKSSRHIYAQIIDDKLSTTLASASSLDKSIRQINRSNSSVSTAEKVGKLVAERAAKKSIEYVVFDRGGYKYHGAVKALADEARKVLKF